MQHGNPDPNQQADDTPAPCGPDSTDPADWPPGEGTEKTGAPEPEPTETETTAPIPVIDPERTAAPLAVKAAEPPLIACTTATSGELAAVRVLGETFLGHHPGARFVALLVDLPGGGTPPAGAVELLRPADLGVDATELARLGTACTAEQLRAVLRPRLLTHLLPAGGPVLHLDPSVVVLGRLEELVRPLLRERPLLLVPRVLEPLPRDGLRPTPAELRAAGFFDPGFLGVAPTAEPFLHTWADLVRQRPDEVGACLDGALALIDHHVLRDPGVGLSVWNAAQRELTKDDTGVPRVTGARLRTAHLHGFDPQRPWLLSADVADRPRVLLSEHPLLAEICAAYRNDLVRAGHTRDAGYRFDLLPDGTPLPGALRRAYREAWLAAERDGTPPPPPAFRAGDAPHDPGDVAEFVAWACEPADDRQRTAGGSRWSAALWADDPELRRTFPDPFGADAAAFRHWCTQQGVPSGRLHPNAVRTPSVQAPPMVDQLGVTVLGTGTVADELRAAAHASGLPTSAEAGYPVVVRCPGAPAPPTDRYVVEVHPDATADLDLTGISELWVLSETARRDLHRLDVPVHAVALPVPDRGEVDLPSRKAARARLGLDDHHAVFLGAAEHTEERCGNALGLVSAFLAAFGERDDARLVLAVTGAADHPEAAERLRLATASDQRIVLVEGTGAEELLDAADCVAALHRAQDPGGDTAGVGERTALLLATAAARGIPVLASDHGAVAELFDRAVAVLVPCHNGGVEPDVRSAARLLRGIADDRDGAREIGRLGREHVLRTRTAVNAADQFRHRVEQAYRSWRGRLAQDRLNQADDPLRPLLVAKHALHRQPEVDAQSRIPMAPALRKAVLRVLAHYDAHLRDMMGALVDGVERTAGELLRRQDEVAHSAGLAELDDVRADLARLADRQQQLADQLVGADDGVLRARADLASQARRLAMVEEVVAAEAAKRGKQIDALAERLDRLAGALTKTLDRIDALETTVQESLRERDQRMESGMRAASQAVRTTDALRRVVVREHERRWESEPRGEDLAGIATSMVLCDAGVLRLPAEDGLMLPWLSTHGVWEPDVGTLIDSLLEPDGVFLDVGAYVGYHTLRVLSRVGTRGTVVAVEPCGRARALLRHNVATNVAPEVARGLTVVEAAAWDTPTEIEVVPALTGGVNVRPQPVAVAASAVEAANNGEPVTNLPDPAARTGGTSVRAVRLDKELEAIPALEDLRLSVVKVDAPGASHRALGGLVRLLRRDRPHVVCAFSPSATAELGDDPAAALREFGTWGYDLVALGGSAPVSPEDVLGAVETAGPGATASLWLRPKDRSG
ncbi:hypothetical protein GCM10012275_64040 [Longimycelium tulufanense]|uniref:Methyltransferase FkbM domain-containing protein n=1 Tax=Longimycelium tulufanense TaxID=907463 RepID=A0A8J3FX98_9PSEU|nr:FkbM family methyltransferase [Longimycelium tulufanense]GGM84524.1 hypothetical protein GCM10012275_64040 [Longimycelium tulufanense]